MINRKRILTLFFCLFILVCIVFSFAACGGGDDGKQITSVSVSYTQGDKVVYTNTSLDELKSSVVVTVQYSDGTTETVTDYVLSGTLNEGESVITLSYKGFEKTFTVNVSEAPDDSHTHTFVKHEAKAATCTEDGNIEYWHCSECGKNFSDRDGITEVDDTAIPMTEHSFSAWETVSEATCETAGSEQRICTICEITETRTTQAVGHSYEIEWTVDVEPTCTEKGSKSHHCSECDDRAEVTEIAALGHTEVTDPAVAPTCTETGLTEGKHCSVCNEVLVAQEAVDALGHTEVNDPAVAPTCTETGLTEGKHCSVCNEVLVAQEVVDALGHTEVTDPAVAPTCTETGLTEGKHCSVCNEVLVAQEAVDALGHTEVIDPAVAPTCTETGLTEGKHCSVCNEVLVAQEVVDALGHTEVTDPAVAPTCTETGLTEGKHCSVCNEVLVAQEAVDALGHTEVIDPAVAPTCTEAGLTEGKHCSVCNEVLVAQEVVDALGHTEEIDPTVAPTCTETGLTEGKHCSVCDAVLVEQKIVDALGHTEVIDPAVAPTCTETGLTEGKHCSVCNAVLIEQEIVEALGHTEVIDPAVTPTCTETGLTDGKHCSVCNEVLVAQETVDALGHTEVIDPAAAPTCTETGLTEGKHCSVCNEVLVAQEAVDALGHTEVTDPAVAPTCTETGLTEGKHCSVCNEVLVAQEVVNALGHTEVTDPAVAPTCTETGLTEGKHCSVCNEVLKAQEMVEALGHTEVNDPAVAPTCTETGLTEGKHCSVCNEVLVAQEAVEELGHRVLVTLQEEQTIEYYTSQNAIDYPFSITGNIITSTNKSDNSSSTYTITALSKFTLELEYMVSSESNYDWLIIKHNDTNIVKASGTSTSTYTALSVFMTAGDTVTISYSKDEGQSSGADCAYIRILTESTTTKIVEVETPVTPTEEIIVPLLSCTDDILCYVCETVLANKLGHTEVTDPAVAPTCTETGHTDGKHCSVCNEVLVAQEVVDALGHDYVHHEAKHANCGEVGWNEYDTCSRCDYSTYVELPIDLYTHCVENGYCRFCRIPESTSGLVYELNPDGMSYTVIGIGTCTDTDIVIGIYNNKSVTSIGERAFYNFSSLTSITIPEGVTSIGERAFYNCSSLTSITIPESVTSIGCEAFYYCRSLTSVTFGEGSQLTSIGEGAFAACYKLVEVYNLSTLNITKGSRDNGWVGYYALVIHTSADEASNFFTDENGYIFYEDGEICYLVGYTGKDTELTLPANCNDKNYGINQYAFCGCSSLTSITIPDSVTSIGWAAFRDCYKLVEVYNLSSLNITIGSTDNGYVGYYALVVHTSKDEASNLFTDENGYIFYEDGDICYLVGYTGNDTELTLPKSCHGKNYGINQGAFYNYSSLTSIMIPDSVTSIGNYAFRYCSSLTSITIPDSVTSIGSYAFSDTAYYNNDENWNNGVLYIGKHLIKAESSVSGSYEIAPGTLTIAGSALYFCTSLTSVTIPNSVTSIGSYAFFGCSSLTSITIPDSVTSIGSSAFSGCSSVESATIPALAISYIPKDNLKTVVITSGESIGDSAFYNCSSLTSITIPSGVTSIGDSAFYNCSSLTSITIPSSVTSIGSSAFFNCSSLTGVYITDIAAWCNISFSFGDFNANPLCYAHNLYLNGELVTDLVIPDSVTSIGNYAFSGCRSLTSITIPSSVTNIGSFAFENCSSLTSITIPDSVTSIGNYAFRYCSSLTSITIPESVTSIGSDAFYRCYKLVEVYNLSSLNITKGSSGNGYAGYYALVIHTSKNEASKLFTDENGYIFCEDGDICYLVGYTGNDTELTLPANCNGKNYGINKYAFYECRSLTSITIPDSVTSIGSSAFYKCSSLTSVTFENTDGWWYSLRSTATSGRSISSSDLEDPSTAAKYLTSNYSDYYWKRS